MDDIPDGYEIRLFYSGDDEAYVAEVSGLTRCVAWGGSCEESLVQAQGAIRAHYQLVRERGDAVPEQASGSYDAAEDTLVDAEVIGKREDALSADRRDRSGWIRMTVDLSVEQHANLSYWRAYSGSDRQRVVRALLRRMEADEELEAAVMEDLEAERVQEVFAKD